MGSRLRYRLSPLAEADLEGIWLYTRDRWSEDQADAYVSDILNVLEHLANGHRMGRPVHHRQGYLKYAVGAHFVFYREDKSGIDVIRVLHQRMNVERYI